MEFEFNLKTKTVVGKGSIAKILPFIEDNQYTKVGVIIDQALKNNPYINQFVVYIQNHIYRGNFIKIRSCFIKRAFKLITANIHHKFHPSV